MAASSTSLSSKSGAAGPLSNKRLFVGNLAETADEYTLIRFLSKHGKISKFDYLFHKAGPKKGRPRGYAFVEYATPEEALKTMLELNDKLLLGRKISIKRANEAPDYSSSVGGGSWRGIGNAPRSTTLSIIKGHKKPESRDSKISALEAKLQLMDAERAASASASEAEAEAEGEPSTSGTHTSQTVASDSKAHPALSAGLPRKPTADTIAKGEAALEAKEAGIKLPPPKEPAKTTLASLNASMGKQ